MENYYILHIWSWLYLNEPTRRMEWIVTFGVFCFSNSHVLLSKVPKLLARHRLKVSIDLPSTNLDLTHSCQVHNLHPLLLPHSLRLQCHRWKSPQDRIPCRLLTRNLRPMCGVFLLKRKTKQYLIKIGLAVLVNKQTWFTSVDLFWSIYMWWLSVLEISLVLWVLSVARSSILTLRLFIIWHNIFIFFFLWLCVIIISRMAVLSFVNRVCSVTTFSIFAGNPLVY